MPYKKGIKVLKTKQNINFKCRRLKTNEMKKRGWKLKLKYYFSFKYHS